jgi:hypothetical protein
MNNEKRMIDDYEVKQALKIGGKEIILAENKKSEERYMVCNSDRKNILGLESYSGGVVSENYLEILNEYVARISKQIEQIKAEREKIGETIHVLTKKDCIPKSLGKNFNGKVIIIKAEKLSPEYRDEPSQLEIALFGNGCNPNAIGQSVFCENLLTGEKSCYRRHDVEGIADVSKLSQWAKEKIAEFEKSKEKPSISERIEKNKTEILSENTSNTAEPEKNNNHEI